MSIEQALTHPVAVLMGGNNAERAISLQTGETILSALQRQSIPSLGIDTAAADWWQRLQREQHCFIALHGEQGEDGTVQGALETLGCSYVGSGVLASALARNKIMCKQFWQGQGLQTPAFTALTEQTDQRALINELGPVVVKPAHVGSSVGTTIVHQHSELADAYTLAQSFDREVLAEQYIQGKEFSVGIVADQILPPIRVEPDGLFYDYHAKYESNKTQYFCPCGLSEDKEQALKDLALAAFNSLGCEHWGRVDVMQNEQGAFFLLEVNTIPGMTKKSLLPMMAEQVGITLDALVIQVLENSLARQCHPEVTKAC